MTLILDLARTDVELVTSRQPSYELGLQWRWGAKSSVWEPLTSYSFLQRLVAVSPATHFVAFQREGRPGGSPWAQLGPVEDALIVELGVAGDNPSTRVVRQPGTPVGEIINYPALWSTTDVAPAAIEHLLPRESVPALVWDWLALGMLTPGWESEPTIPGWHRRD